MIQTFLNRCDYLFNARLHLTVDSRNTETSPACLPAAEHVAKPLLRTWAFQELLPSRLTYSYGFISYLVLAFEKEKLFLKRVFHCLIKNMS